MRFGRAISVIDGCLRDRALRVAREVGRHLIETKPSARKTLRKRCGTLRTPSAVAHFDRSNTRASDSVDGALR